MDVIKTENIKVGVQARNRGEVFAAIAELAVSLGYAANAGQVVEGLEVREAQGSTGMEEGFAIPHVLGDVVTQAGVIVLRLTGEVSDWETFDDKPVDYVIALLAPGHAAGSEHLKLLSAISRILVHEENRQALRNAAGPQEIYEIISSKM